MERSVEFTMSPFPLKASSELRQRTVKPDSLLTPPQTPPLGKAQECYFERDDVAANSAVGPDEEPVVAVIGVGYVGLHLVEAFSRQYKVIAFDISDKRLASVANKLPQSDNLMITSNSLQLAAATHYLIAVPTLVIPGTSRVDSSWIQSALDTISEIARAGSTVVIESSVAVGMTRSLLGKMIQERGLKAGMSPERVDPGRTFPSFDTIPKIISGLDDLAPGSLSSIHALYSRIFEQLIPVTSPEVAEMTKLYENCQRMVCIAYANEMSDACQNLPNPIDPFEVSRAAATKPFGYLPFEPSAGVGGHCIPINPHYLFSTCELPLLRRATRTMDARPAAMADRCMRKLYSSGLRSQGRPKLLVVGAAFKAGQDNLSNSPGVQIINHLLDCWEVNVSFADPLVEEDSVPQAPKLNEISEWNVKSLNDFDAVIVVIRQVGLDFDVLDALERTLVSWCCGR